MIRVRQSWSGDFRRAEAHPLNALSEMQIVISSRNHVVIQYVSLFKIVLGRKNTCICYTSIYLQNPCNMASFYKIFSAPIMQIGGTS